MSIQEVIVAINQMTRSEVIDTYAIGGAVGAAFYLEPVATMDVDIFITLSLKAGQSIVTLQPIYDYLTARGCFIEAEHIFIAGWPVQFLPATAPLVEEALKEAVTKDVDGVPARVFAAEHLAAIALQTARAKDKARLLQFIEAGVLDVARFQSIILRHGLVDQWRKFERQFFND